MAKKTKTGQQRIKEEQWRKRMTTQAGRTPGGAVMDVEDVEADTQTELPMGQTTYTASAAPVAPAAPAATPHPTSGRSAAPSMTAAQRSQSAATAAAQRRAQSTATRTARTRLTTSMMSIDEEMHYVRSDIRTLIFLTIICVAIIIILSFIIK